MLRTGADYLESLRDGRKVLIGKEVVRDVTAHPAFRATARSFARIYDLKRAPQHVEAMSFEDGGQRHAVEASALLEAEDGEPQQDRDHDHGRPQLGQAIKSTFLRSRKPSDSSNCRPARASSTGSAVRL